MVNTHVEEREVTDHDRLGAHLLNDDNWLRFPRRFLHLMTPDEWVVLAVLMENNYDAKHKAGGWIECTMEFLQQETGLDEYAQRKALKALELSGRLEFEPRELPAKRHVRIIDENLYKGFLTEKDA